MGSYYKIDLDDTESINYCKGWSNSVENLTFIIDSRKNGYNSLVNHYEKMVDIAKGRYVWGFSDNTTILTEEWNYILNNVLLSPFKIYYPYIDFHRESLPIYPKKWKEILGHIAPHSGIDVYIQRIMELDGIQDFGKPLNSDYVEYVDDIEILHNVGLNDETTRDKYTFRGGDQFQIDARNKYYDSPYMLKDKDKIFNYLNS